MLKAKILICDDEEGIRRYLQKMFQAKDFEVETFADGTSLLARIEAGIDGDADILLQDVRMPDMDGIEVLKRVKKLRPSLPVVVMTAFGTIDSAVDAIKLGAYDYVTKPFPREKILGVIDNALEMDLLMKENKALKEELARPDTPDNIIFTSAKFREVYELTLQVAGSDANILILGESGTGKERDFIPVGATKAKNVDIRFVAATNKDLAKEVREGRFREDLYYRLNVITINLPPLRERAEDVIPLAEYFLQKYSRRVRKELKGISPEAVQVLQGYHWPGNVRELENVVERAAILARGEFVTPDVLPMYRQAAGAPAPLAPPREDRLISLEVIEKEHIERILRQTGWHKSRSAEILGISRKTLDRKIVEYALTLPGGAPAEDE